MAAREPFNATARPPAVMTQRSPWHSPVPYLFGGLAAMLGLIAFALLILACSYWKLSGYLEGGNGDGSGDRDLEAGAGDDDTQKAPPPPPVFEEKILVIMAGEAKPTFLATPISSRSSSFGDGSSKNDSCVCTKKSEAKPLEMADPTGEKPQENSCASAGAGDPSQSRESSSTSTTTRDDCVQGSDQNQTH